MSGRRFPPRRRSRARAEKLAFTGQDAQNLLLAARLLKMPLGEFVRLSITAGIDEVFAIAAEESGERKTSDVADADVEQESLGRDD